MEWTGERANMMNLIQCRRTNCNRYSAQSLIVGTAVRVSKAGDTSWLGEVGAAHA
jgi:hypothetical protein